MTLQVNPWYVINLEDFLFYCCPECDNKTKNPKAFLNHAVTSHPNAKIALLLKPESDEKASEDSKDNNDPKDDILSEMFKFSCDKCNYQTTKKTLLEEHKITHLDEDVELIETTPDVMICESLTMTCPDKDEEGIEVDSEMISQIDPPVVEIEKEPIMQELPSPNKKLKQIKECSVKIKILGKRNQKLVKKKEEIHRAAKQKEKESESMNITPDTCQDKDKEVIVPCTMCDKQFNSSLALNSHLVSQHELQSEFQCPECSHSFVNTLLLTAHKIEQHNFDPFKKNIKVIEVDGNADDLMSQSDVPPVQSDEDYDPFIDNDQCLKSLKQKCPQCPKSSPSFAIEELKAHVQKVHETVEEPPAKIKILGNTNQVKKEEIYQEVCDKCGKSFKNYESLRTHKQHHFPKFYLCSLCDRIFTKKVHLRKHLETEHKIFEKEKEFLYVCDQCDLRFNNFETLNSHLKSTHGFTDIYPCDECDKVYTKHMLLTSHKIEVHNFNPLKKELSEEEKAKMFQCPDCGLYLKTSFILKAHMKTHDTENFNFHCDQCDYKTYAKSVLKLHVRRKHLKIKETKHVYKCNLCTKHQNSKVLLKEHYLNEHGITDYVEEKEPPKFKCEQCDFQTNGISVLKKHVSKNHKVLKVKKNRTKVKKN